MDLTLSMASHDLVPEDLHVLTLDLCGSLNAESGLEAAMVEGKAPPTARGDLVTIGSLAVTLLTSGTAVALLNVLKSYFDRSSALTVELARPNGTKLTLRVDDVRSGQLERTLSLASQFLEARGT